MENERLERVCICCGTEGGTEGSRARNAQRCRKRKSRVHVCGRLRNPTQAESTLSSMAVRWITKKRDPGCSVSCTVRPKRAWVLHGAAIAQYGCTAAVHPNLYTLCSDQSTAASGSIKLFHASLTLSRLTNAQIGCGEYRSGGSEAN